jgi:hypothetical protein
MTDCRGKFSRYSAGSGGKVKLPIPTKEGGQPDDAQFDHECIDSRDQAFRQAFYLDASQHCPDVS